jgi:hypothetical protein
LLILFCSCICILILYSPALDVFTLSSHQALGSHSHNRATMRYVIHVCPRNGLGAKSCPLNCCVKCILSQIEKWNHSTHFMSLLNLQFWQDLWKR